MEQDGKPHISVVMALYRPHLARLERQIGSIQEQAGAQIDLTLFADGPMTQLPMVEELIGGFPNVQLVQGETNLGPSDAFIAALGYALKHRTASEFFAFADQDDIWLTDKLARSVETLNAIQADAVHTDAMLVDEGGETIASSMFDYEHRDTAPTLQRLFFRNNATGMTMVITRALAQQMVDLAQVRPRVWLHDHFAAFLATSKGGLACLQEPTVQYVQHDDNVVGAKASASSIGTSGNFRKAGSKTDLALEQGLQLVEALRQSDWPTVDGQTQLAELSALLSGRGVVDLLSTLAQLVRLSPQARPLMARLAWCKLTSHEWRG